MKPLTSTTRRIAAVCEATAPVSTVVLASGASAHATLDYAARYVGTAGACRSFRAAYELNIIPPGQDQVDPAAFDFDACVNPAASYLGVSPIVAGVGTVSG